MKTKSRVSQDQLEIYEETKGVVTTTLLVAVFVTFCPIIFIYLGIREDITFFIVIGSIISLVGLFLFLGLPKSYRNMKDDAGNIIFQANSNGISIKPSGTYDRINYSWDDILRISLTKKKYTVESDDLFKDKKGTGRIYQANTAIVYFRRDNSKDKLGILESSRKDIWLSPTGLIYSDFIFPKDEIDLVEQLLVQYSSDRCEIASFNRIIFNFSDRSENCF